MTQLEGRVDKGWGYEFIFATNDLYCGKMMVFEKTGAKFSMHFHHEKDETWFIQKGKFLLRWIDTKNAKVYEEYLNENDTRRITPLTPHQLEALEEGSVIIEVSTPDSVEDNYRVMPGDSQTK